MIINILCVYQAEDCWYIYYMTGALVDMSITSNLLESAIQRVLN